jgi:hypothetical protein
MKTDWKFALMAFLAVAGVIVPLGVSQFQSDEKLLSVRTVSIEDLDSYESGAIPELKLTINGAVVESPYFTKVQLVNEGTIPILASDFATPLTISIDALSVVVRAATIDVVPSDLPVTLNQTGKDVSISPLLLNPGDSFAISILTSGEQPHFSVSARIAGVTRIELEEMMDDGLTIEQYITHVLLSCIGIVLYFTYAVQIIRPGAIKLTTPLTLISMICFAIASAASMNRISEDLGIDGWQEYIVKISFVTLIAVILLPFYLRTKKLNGTALKSKWSE